MSEWTHETLLAHLSYGFSISRYTLPPPIPSTPLPREETAASTSSIGALDALPLELLHLILERTDVLTLLRFARTSLRAKSVVSSLHIYNVLLAHAPEALRQLALCHLLSHHQTLTIYQALISTACSSCHQSTRATHFYLPSAQRVCFSCLRMNPGLWLVPLSLARRCFKLSASSTAKLPLVRFQHATTTANANADTTDNSECTGEAWKKKKRKPEPCVSVRDARRLAESVHGSMEEVYRLHTQGGMRASCLMEGYVMQFLRDAPCTPFTPSLLASTGWWEEIAEYLVRLLGDLGVAARESVVLPWPDASMVPPSSSKLPLAAAGVNTVEAFWCQGCSKLAKWYLQGMLDKEACSKLVPGVSDGFETIEALYALSMRVWSRDEFWRHISTCYAVQHDMPHVRLAVAQLPSYLTGNRGVK
ncbi:hypothetical protein MGYG_08259 [Nannizzia gypsea CBS 118893]|uniref:F-box domain-containing protein n=1 Tax=Arthroderma gypseum (strain ATCC MYA-4604 / CBS 118893) TaxID=535722 RepID=E4V664_ARTGP|nr:hypothetical protein MGYG_08259 [Nannizzia gypsea CBS 118893]EFR05247.1 hypothetical protein MGYG_08259 [Nannizzia gypsea CBS 118893]